MAYPNKSINEGGFGSYLAAAALAIYLRVKFVAPAGADGKASLDVAAIGDTADAVTLAPIASGAYGPVKFLNAPGETYGVCVGTIAVGGAVYSAAAGKVSAVSTGGAILIGKATCAGYDGGVITYAPIQ
jgi:hypothetical protein